MEFVKKNPIFAIVIAVCVVAAGFFLLRMRAAARAGEQSYEKVEKLSDFAQREKRADFSATLENRETAAANKLRADRELQDLRMGLHARSRIETSTNVSGIECKNLILEATRSWRDLLERRLVQVGTTAADFAFGEVIGSERLPNQTSEVPILLKQLQIVGEVVNLIVSSNISGLQSVARPGGVAVASEQYFTLMPFSVRVDGDLAAVKEFLTKLQADSDLFFVVRSVTLSAPDTAVKGASTAGMEPGRPRRGRPRDLRELGEIPGGEGDGTVSAVPPKAERQVSFSPVVMADIRFDFLEFTSPVEEN